jgi:hypothetical protein
MRLRPRAAARRREAIAPLLTGVLLRGLRDALRGAPMKASARKRLLAMGLIEKERDHYSRLTSAGLRALRESATELKGPCDSGSHSKSEDAT